MTLAENNAALRIDFEPLKSWPIELPKNALFAVLHSNVESNKAATAHYNERVVECRIAAQVRGKTLSAFIPSFRSFSKSTTNLETATGSKFVA